MEVKEECFGERFYIYYVKIDARPSFSDPIIILDNKGIDKLSPLSFYADMIMEDKSIEDTKNEGNLKNLQLSYLKSPLSSVDENVLNNLLFESSISPRTERPIKRRKRVIPKRGWKIKEKYAFTAPHITKKLLQQK